MVVILYPDQRILDRQPDNETCVFAAPIDICDWNYLHALAAMNKRLLGVTKMRYIILKDEAGIAMGDAHVSVYFMRNTREINDQVCILLRDMETPDECLESAAWIRITKRFHGMIYICQGSITADKWQTHAASLGANEESVCMVDLDYSGGDSK